MNIEETFKIDEVWYWRIRLPYKEPFTTSFGTEDKKETIILQLKSGDIYGYGEVVAGLSPRYSPETLDTVLYILKKHIIPYLKYETSPIDINFKLSWIRGNNMAKAAIEMALWDIYSKIHDKPLYKVLGGVRRYVDVGVSIGIKKDVDTLLKTISNYLDQGYMRIKIKVKPGWDIEVLDMVRKEYPDIKLTVDANASYILEKHASILRKMDEFNLLYIEQPLQYNDLVGHMKLQRMINTPLCLDESITDSHKAWEAIELGATKVINIKPGRVGGIYESRKIHDIAMDRNTPVWIGGMLETGIGRAFNVSLATMENVKYPSDISASNRYYEKDIIVEPFTLESGSKIKVRDGPGIGVEIDWEYLEQVCIKRGRLL